MSSTSQKESNKFFSLAPRGSKKRGGVRRGISEALGALRFRPDEDDDTNSVSSSPPIVVNSADKKPRSPTDMALFGRNKKQAGVNKAATEPQRTASGSGNILKANPAPRVARPEPSRRMSVNSTNTSDVSDSTIAQSDHESSQSFLDKTKTALAKNASPTSTLQRAGSDVVTVAVNNRRNKLETELKGSKEQWLAAGVSSESFFGFIAQERLRRMPPKGSRWDKILKWAEDFGQKLSLFEDADESFIASGKDAVDLILACLQILLLLGPSQGEALERAFGLFHEYGLTLDLFKRNASLLVYISEARRHLGLVLADMLGLTVDMAIVYRKSVRSISTSVTLDFNTTFGKQMESFVVHKNRIAELMWTWQLRKSSEIDMSDHHVTIVSIRQYLLPQDRTTQALATGRRSTTTVRAEFTCEWFDRPLVDFSRSKDRVLTVSAEAGAGKSALFGWILERLQRPLGSREFQCIQASVDSQVPAQASQTALVKALLLQLLEQNVGNVALFRCLANVTELSASTSSEHDTEDALWYTLETALKGLDNVVLAVDGLDSLEGDEAHKAQAFDRLHDIATKNRNVRVIILSRPLSKPWSKPVRQIAMTPERTAGDVKHVVRAYLTNRRIGTKPEIDEVAEQVARRSKGSLTWADLSLQYFAKANTIADISKTVKELPTTHKELLEKRISNINLKGDGLLILSWLLVSNRPLTVAEIQANLELDIHKASHRPRPTNAVEDIRNACGPLIVIQDKTVRIRNETIRLHLLEKCKKEATAEGALMSPAEAHKDLAARLLLYVKICVTRNTEPSMDELSTYEVDNLFRSHAMLEYAARNWLGHFQRSSYFAAGQLQISPNVVAQLKSIFPSSTLLPLLERSCWEKQTILNKANGLHLLALNIRKQILGESTQCVLQGCINVAQAHKKMSASAEAGKYFYQAAKASQSLLGRNSELATAAAAACVESSASVKADSRNDAVNQREEMLKYVVEAEEQRSGANSAVAAHYKNQLAQLYADVSENDKAEAVYREVYNVTVAQNGEFSEDSLSAAEKLKTVLYKGAKHEDVVQYTQPVFEAAERDLDIFDVRRVEITLQMADSYEKKNDLVLAEELYISLWRGLTEHCRSTRVGASEASVAEAHERKVQISIAYARFLRRHGREAEAQNILHGVWLDYQARESKSEGLVKRLHEVGEELKSMGILETAIAVFKSVWGYFKGSGKHTSAAAVTTAVALMGAVHEKSEKKQKAKQTAKAKGTVEVDDIEESDDEADAIMDEIVQTAVAAPAARGVKSQPQEKSDSFSVETCETLYNFYTSKKRWNEAAQVCAKLLKQIWPDMGVKVGLPKAYRTEAIRFARRLALCHREAGQTQQAEKTYNIIFQSAVRSGLPMTDELVVESSNELIALYKRTQQPNKALEVYQQLLEGYRTTLGARNALTIKTLYAMGDLCLQNRLKGADKYYLEVVSAERRTAADNGGAISKEAVRAALALSKIYYEQKRWEEARGIYETLWSTITTRVMEYNDVLPADVVEVVYKRYTTVLNTHLKVDVETTRNIAVEYRDTCTRAFGPDARITASATLALSEVCRRSKNPEHQTEAVRICEEVVTKAEKQFSEGTATSMAHVGLLASAKRHLASLYATQSANGTAAMDSAASQKAETLWREQLESNKKEHGVAHKATLASLASLVGVWAKSEKPEVQKQTQEHLQTTVIDVLGESCAKSGGATDSTKLHEAAVSLAGIYLSCNYTAQAWALLKSLRIQIVAKGKPSSAEDKAGVKLPENIDRRSMVFLAAFEETLREAQVVDSSTDQAVVKVTFSDIMTDMLTESILYDRYSLSVASKELSVEQKLFDGARLYSFLKTTNREQHTEQILALEEALFAIFTEKYGASIKTESSITHAFLVAVIEELGLLRHHADIVAVSCTAIVARVRTLIESDRFGLAAGLATALDQFMTAQKGYKAATIPFTFKLSLYLSGLGTKKTTDVALQARMLELSKRILRSTLAACKSTNIDLVQLQASELNNLVRLMGEQKNYEDLEWLLTQLWNSRTVQMSWSASTVIAVGRRLVQVLFVRGKREAAISLAESMAYNLRRTWGLLDPATVEVNDMLSTLFVADNRYADALDVHAEVLRVLLDLGDDDLPEGMDEEHAASLAMQQLQLVRTLYARSGGWPDHLDAYAQEDLASLAQDAVHEFADVAPEAFAAFGDGNPAEWGTVAPPAADRTGLFVAPASWEFGSHYYGEEAEGAAARKQPAHMLRSLKLVRQRSFGNLASDARRQAQAQQQQLEAAGSKSVGAAAGGNASGLLVPGVH